MSHHCGIGTPPAGNGESREAGIGSACVPISAVEQRVAEACAAFAALEHVSPTRIDALHVTIVAMHEVCGALATAIESGVSDARIHAWAAPAREFAACSPFISRLQSWPRGYPGDFETVECIMAQAVLVPPDSPAYWIERHALTCGITQQHRNKVNAQARAIIEAAESCRHGPARILVLASGSSPDLVQALPVLKAAGAYVTIVDSDSDAISLSMSRLAEIGTRLSAHTGHVLAVAPKLQQQGPYDLVVAGGLFDYLPNRHALSLIKSVVNDLLQSDGQFFFTNLAEPNPYRGWMRHVANWRVLERSAEDLGRLVERACGDAVNADIAVDGTGLALLAMCARRPTSPI